MSIDITIRIPDDLGRQLEAYRDRLPELLERGLRDLELEAAPEMGDAAEIVSRLSSAPHEQVLAIRPSETLQQRMTELLGRSKSGSLSRAEEMELDRYLYLEHLVRLAKTRDFHQAAPSG